MAGCADNNEGVPAVARLGVAKAAARKQGSISLFIRSFW